MNLLSLFRRRKPPVDREAVRAELRVDLARRMDRPQRHRLLHGYPMPQMMNSVGDRERPSLRSLPVWGESRIVGILPHPFCVPAVRGCGFCSFPHERFEKDRMLDLAAAISGEIRSRKWWFEEAETRAVYLGGGTANLVSDEALAMILGALSARARLDEAEITLEGVPRFFRERQLELLTAMSQRVRISMGVQTFHQDWLRKMGRTEFGSPEHVRTSVELARRRSVTTSCDLLINLPGQPIDEMLADVNYAIDLGFEQICVYHLVLFGGMGTEWAKDASLVNALPGNERSFENWLRVRQHLDDKGYVQSTLTNFERRDLTDSQKFLYEPLSFRMGSPGEPLEASLSALGFGPGAISFLNGHRKWMNAVPVDDYLHSAAEGFVPERTFQCRRREMGLVVLTRGLSLLSVPLMMKRWIIEEFEDELLVLEEGGLVERSEESLDLTLRGMFYADSVAGLLASRCVAERRAEGLVAAAANDPIDTVMG